MQHSKRSRKSSGERSPQPDCEHASVRKGYYLGLDTEDYVCVSCGKSGVGPDWPLRRPANPYPEPDQRKLLSWLQCRL